MGRTIIQPIGPLYGEDVNGTVFGRPNGSIFVPSVNTVEIKKGTLYIRNGTGASATNVYFALSNGQYSPDQYIMVAQSQDNAAYLSIQLAEDSDFTVNLKTINLSAGLFNVTRNTIATDTTLTTGSTYYIRAVLNAATSVPVAYSTTIEVEAVEP